MPEQPLTSRLLASRWFDPGLAAVVTIAALGELAARPELEHSPRTFILVPLLGALLAIRRSHPVPATYLAAVLFAAAHDIDDGALPQIGLVVPLILGYSCGAHEPGRRGVLAVGALAAGLQVGVGFEEFPNFELYAMTFAPWWVGSQVGRRRSLVAELAERTAQLEAEQDAFTQLAVRRERARIARELHDIVAHHLAVVVIQAGAGRMAAPGQPERAAERFASVREAAGQALTEMARLVDIIEADRHTGAGGLERLHVLIDDARDGGVHVRFASPAPDVELPEDVEDGVYRVIQEGLTNAIKHAPGAEVRVRLSVRDDALEVEVSDAGAPSSASLASTGAGLGLTGMRERVEALGGTLEAGRRADGDWRLTARLPVSVQAVAAVG